MNRKLNQSHVQTHIMSVLSSSPEAKNLEHLMLIGIKDLVKTTYNDQELGKKIRELIESQSPAFEKVS